MQPAAASIPSTTVPGVAAAQKIAYVVSLFPCWSETFIVNEIEELSRRGFEVEIFSLRYPRERLVQEGALPFLPKVHYPKLFAGLPATLRRLLRDPLPVLRVLGSVLGSARHSPAMALKTLAMLPRAFHFLGRIDRLGIRHVHAHWATYPATACWVFRRCAGIGYSFTAHAHDIWLEKPLLARKIGESRFVVAISEYNRKYLEAYAGEAKDRIKVIHCGLDLRRFPYRPPVPSSPPSILSVGRLDEIKGFRHLLEACRILRDGGFPFRCTIIGDGPLRPSLERQVRVSGLEELVELAPAMTHEALIPRIRECTLLVAPSVRTVQGNQDGIPVILMEAMALGAPVLGTRISGIPELIEDGVNGFLAPPGNPAMLARAIREACGSAGRLEAVAAAARKTIEERFEIVSTVDALVREIEAAGRDAERAGA